MNPAIIPHRLALVGLLIASPLFAGFKEDIGFPELRTEIGSSLPNGSNVNVAQIEYVRDGSWAPEAAAELAGKTFTYSPSSPSAFSYHANEVGRVFYGSSSSLIPAVSQIKAFETWDYFDNSLNVGKGTAPLTATWDVENHSYIASSGLLNNEGSRRLDYRVDHDGVTATVVLENGTGAIPALFGNTYNPIVVGTSTGQHSRGGTTRDLAGRLKPDIVGTATYTSYAGPIVGSAAGLLISEAKSNSSLSMAKRPETIKAILMAGATKDEFPSWSRTASAPLDPIYGSGELNIYNSYNILLAGRQAASSSTVRGVRGWDLNSTATSLRYYFTIGSGQSGTVSAILTWHRQVTPNNGAWNQGITVSVDNYDLRLYRSNAQLDKGDLLQDSVSTIDNVEHIYLQNVAAGTYMLEVTSVSGSKQFGIAWNVIGVDGSSSTDNPPQVDAPSITTQPSATSVTSGSSASFSVGASGTAPFTYQWKKDGVAISGATSSSFTIASASTSNSGTYQVVVSNSAGSATSNGAYLTVNQAVTPPSITSQPSAASANVGGSASFSVIASGTSPFSYQWKKDGVSISGATSNVLSLTSLAQSDAGTYSVVVTNSAGSATSNGAYLTVNNLVTAPSITSQPTAASVLTGGNAGFSVTASGTSPFTYQWKKDGVSILGATSSSLSLTGVTLSSAGTYSVVVTNSAGSATSNGAYLTVTSSVTPPTITSNPSPTGVTEGGSVSFQVVASGTAPFTFQWKLNGGFIAGANEATYTVVSATKSDGGTYQAVVSNSAGSVTSAGAWLTVKSAPTAPSITSQPASVSLVEGQDTTLSVTAAGTSPFTYQWRKDGVSISGATSSSLALSGVSLNDRGIYSVVVTNSVGSVASNGATVSVSSAVIAPAITSQPSAAAVTEGGNASFSVTASGTSPFSYQWKKDGVAISGATSNSISLSSISLNAAGTYSVVVSNSAGSVTSNGAYLTVTTAVVAPSISSQPYAVTVTEGGNASFSVTASGTSPFSYQWKKDGVAISGATSNSISLSSISLNAAGTYSVVVSNSAGSVTSNGAYLTVTTAVIAPSISSQPAAMSVVEGGSASFGVSASGTGPLSYQWRKDGVAINGATSKTLSLSGVSLNSAGNYSVVVSNSVGSIASNAAYLSVSTQVTPPTVTTPPSPKTVTEGGSVSFSVAVSGTAPFQYQWKLNGGLIAGANGATYTIASATKNDVGTYQAVVSNSAGTVTSSGAWLTVNSATTAPAITSQPAAVSVVAGGSATFSVTASGIAPFNYQWRKGGVAISGATQSTFSIASVAMADAGSYSVVVSNAAGSATSSSASLTVSQALTAPSITKQPTSSDVAEGAMATFAVTAGGSATLGYQWFKDGLSIVGATSATYTISSAKLSDAATYKAVVTNSVGQAVSSAVTLTVHSAPAAVSSGKLANISSRSKVGTGSDILISGFVLSGTQPKKLLVRAVGPSLAQFGLKDLLSRPKVQIFTGTTMIADVAAGSRLPSLDESQAASKSAGAFALPDGSMDTVIVRTFDPGSYTVQVSGDGGATGVAIVEVYDLEPDNSASQVINLSTRSSVGRDGEILVPGVFVSGSGPRQLLIRAVGPGLKQWGVNNALKKPTLSLYKGSDLVIKNVGWATADNADEIAAVFSKVGAFPLNPGDADSALLVTLMPGAYTLHVSDADGGTGIVLAELFEVP